MRDLSVTPSEYREQTALRAAPGEVASDARVTAKPAKPVSEPGQPSGR